jgi:2-keto-4-pentenoate hydratase/2-oxohepta-3-ene-1,7-dioic acid hydratase in catechol pathway
MRLYTFATEQRTQIGIQLNERLYALADALDLMMAEGLFRQPGQPRSTTGAQAEEHSQFGVYADMMGCLWAGERGAYSLREALRLADDYPDVVKEEGLLRTFDSVQIRAPIPRPGKILCSGINYRSHAKENPNAKMPAEPFFFSKLPSAVIGPGEPIVKPRETEQLDYEVEFAVVIGRQMRRTPESDVMKHVFGYTILHDVSARDVQFKDNQITLGKNFDTFCPLGPCIVTTDELTDPGNVRLRSFVNGQLMQDGTTADWLFPLPVLLSRLSQVMMLEPGDIVSTGTPAGVGVFRKPPVFLKPGDTVRLEIEGIGVLENPVAAEE